MTAPDSSNLCRATHERGKTVPSPPTQQTILDCRPAGRLPQVDHGRFPIWNGQVVHASLQLLSLMRSVHSAVELLPSSPTPAGSRPSSESRSIRSPFASHRFYCNGIADSTLCRPDTQLSHGIVQNGHTTLYRGRIGGVPINAQTDGQSASTLPGKAQRTTRHRQCSFHESGGATRSRARRNGRSAWGCKQKHARNGRLLWLP